MSIGNGADVDEACRKIFSRSDEAGALFVEATAGDEPLVCKIEG